MVPCHSVHIDDAEHKTARNDVVGYGCSTEPVMMRVEIHGCQSGSGRANGAGGAEVFLLELDRSILAHREQDGYSYHLSRSRCLEMQVASSGWVPPRNLTCWEVRTSRPT